MAKTKKALILALSAIFVLCVALFTVTACGKKKELTSVEVTTPPAKVDYVAGEAFNPDGLKVSAVFSDESKVELTSEEYTITSKNDDLAALTTKTTSVTITYKYEDVEKTTTQKITVHNNIVSATVKTYPKQEYFVGESFNIAGMVISATYEDGSKSDVEVTTTNAKVTPDGILSKATKEVTVTVNGYDVKVPVTMLNAIYVEAETGYRNGAAIEQTTGDSGNLRTDSTTADAQTGAKTLYEAHLKAQFALEKMLEADEELDVETLAATPASADELSEVFGGNKAVYNPSVKVGGEIVSKLFIETVKWLNDSANKEAIDAYVASDDYKNAVDAYVKGTNEDKAEWNYTDRVNNFAAHAGGDGKEYYLGQNKPGDVISFTFKSSAATTGSVQFRLSSAYLYADSSWKAVMMGDIQLNKLADIYVNGVKADISDELVLEGGKAEDGSICQVLWTNWKEVTLNGIAFVEGRNVIELRIKRHGITAQESYNFAANIDTLIVAPSQKDGKDTSELDTFENDSAIKVVMNVTSATIAKNGEKAILTIGGTYTGADGIKGYLFDKLSASVGGLNVEITANNGTFTGTVDVTSLALGDYKISANGTDATVATAGTVTVDRNEYTLKADGSLTVSSDYNVTNMTFTLPDENANEKINLVLGTGNNKDKVYINIEGTFEATYVGYDMNNAADRKACEEKLAEALDNYFFFDMTKRSNWSGVLKDVPITYTVNAVDKTFVLIFEVTDCPIVDDSLAYIHMAPESNRNPDSNNWWDYKPNTEAFTKTVTVGNLLYTLSYKTGDSGQTYGLVYLTIANTGKANVALTSATLEKKTVAIGDAAAAEHPVLVLSGKIVDYKGDVITDAAVIAEQKANVEKTLEYEALVGFTTWAGIGAKSNATIEWDGAEFKIYLVIDDTSTNIADGIKIVFHKNFAFLGDTKINDNNLTPANVQPTVGSTVTVGGFTYTIYDHNTMPDTDGGWQKNFIIIEVTAVA